jgi:ABC-type nitrate/sulfonate/bicarbonate transport system substrate-binding protein
MKHQLTVALAGLTVISLAVGCSGGGAGPAPAGLTTVRIGTQPYYDYQFFQVAHDLGIDREFGLNLVDVPEPGQTAYPQLAAGAIDVAASCESCALPAISNFPQLRDFLITELFKGFVLIGRTVNGRPQFKTYFDFLRADAANQQKAGADFAATLKGRSFAINPAADGSLFGALLAHAGLKPADTKVISFPDEGKAALAFISGAGDYYFGSLPQEVRMLTSADLKGRFVEAGPASLFPLNYANFAATSSWLASHQDVATRLVAVWFRVTQYLYQQPGRLLAIIARNLQSQTGGLLSSYQTKVALTKFMYFAPFANAYATYYNPKSPTWQGIALRELYQQAEEQKQISPGTNYWTYEVDAKYFSLLEKRPDLIKKIEAPIR